MATRCRPLRSGESNGKNAEPLVTQRGHELFHGEFAVVQLFEHFAAAGPGLGHAPKRTAGQRHGEAKNSQRHQQLEQRKSCPAPLHQRTCGFSENSPLLFLGT